MIKKEVGIGFLFGLVANFIGVLLYTLVFSELGFLASVREARQEEVLGRLIAAGAVLNFLPFFYFLNRNKIYRSRGVLLASILAALIIGLLQIIEPVEVEDQSTSNQIGKTLTQQKTYNRISPVGTGYQIKLS